MAELPASLAGWVRLPGPAAVLEAIVVRARRGNSTESGRLTSVALSEPERRQVGRLLGTTWELSGRPVRLQDLAVKLSEHGLSVRELTEAAHGEAIEPNSIERDRAKAAADSERQVALSTVTTAGLDSDVVARWLDDRGLPQPGNGELLRVTEQVAAVFIQLSRYDDRVWLAQLAADAFNNAHALDADHVLGRAIARLAAVAHGLPRPQRAGRDWRAAWASIGVTCDALSSRVLALNLPLLGDSSAAEQCATAAGEPMWLTLRSLTSNWTSRPTEVFVCENVTIAQAAADALGASCPPLVCTDGIASGAALDLLTGLAQAGCSFRARADFDMAGFTIAEQVLSVAPDARSWQYDAHTYATECSLGGDHQSTDDLAAAVPTLRALYGATQIPIHEERLLPGLLSDLRGQRG